MRDGGGQVDGVDRQHGGVRPRCVDALNADALDQLFLKARTPRGWLEKPVPRELIEQIYDAVRMGPTSMNSTPARFLFIAGRDGKERLRPSLSRGNVDKAMKAPVVVVVGVDHDFVRHMPVLWPHRDVAALFAEKPGLQKATAQRNAVLQGAYLIMAARAFGLDCGPMSGFDAALVDETFFAGTSIRAEFMCCLGYGDPETFKPRLPRLEFSQACMWA